MEPSDAPAALVGDREIAATRTLDAPRDVVFKMWTDLAHLDQWWGPRGFTTTTFKRAMKPGGVWRFVMHGPDGRDYENNVTFLEVVPNERIVFEHGGDDAGEPVGHRTMVTFADAGDGRTTLTMRMVFASATAREHVVRAHDAVAGLGQTLGRLGEHLARRDAPPEEFVITRTFDAPRELVWKAWTERDRLMQWFGPKGYTMTVANLDFRPGGTFHYCLRTPAGKDMWGKFVYREIVPPRRIVLVNSFSDAQGGLTTHPFSPTWPRQTLSTTTFTERDGKTTVTVDWRPLDATQEEIDTFKDRKPSMTGGWTGTFEQLDDYLGRTA